MGCKSEGVVEGGCSFMNRTTARRRSSANSSARSSGWTVPNHHNDDLLVSLDHFFCACGGPDASSARKGWVGGWLVFVNNDLTMRLCELVDDEG
jgi:hypothetical protein